MDNRSNFCPKRRTTALYQTGVEESAGGADATIGRAVVVGTVDVISGITGAGSWHDDLMEEYFAHQAKLRQLFADDEGAGEYM